MQNTLSPVLAPIGYSYDALGNLVEIPATYGSSRHYHFSPDNRMMAAWHDTSLDEYGFVYDASGERVVRYLLEHLIRQKRSS